MTRMVEARPPPRPASLLGMKVPPSDPDTPRGSSGLRRPRQEAAFIPFFLDKVALF
jgi:hypothetical protein